MAILVCHCSTMHVYIEVHATVSLWRLSATRATIIAIFCTLSEVFDVPVYWPILVVYFFTLFALTLRRQIQYVLPFSVPLFKADLCSQTYDKIQVCSFRHWSQGALWRKINYYLCIRTLVRNSAGPYIYRNLEPLPVFLSYSSSVEPKATIIPTRFGPALSSPTRMDLA